MILLTDLLKRVSRVRATPQGALVANAVLARETVHGQFLLVTATEIPWSCGCGSVGGCPHVGTDLLQTLHLHGDIF